MPSLKIWGQDDIGSGAEGQQSQAAASDATKARGWFRSLDEYQGVRGLGAGVHRVEPGSLIPDSLSRRSFLQLLGGGMGVAGMSACFKPPNGHILPYGKQAPESLPGEPVHYATGLDIDGLVTPLLVTCFDGRPIKVEGNPEHPENQGSTGVFEQAILDQLYDANRVQDVSEKGQVRSLDSLRGDLRQQLRALDATGGAGLRLLVAPSSSPLVRDRRAQVLKKYPKAKIVEYSPLAPEPGAGTVEAFGQPLGTTYEISTANVVVSLDADFVWPHAYGHRVPREFASRRATATAADLNRLYVAEANLSLTGMMADHRLRLRSADIGTLALALLRAVTVRRPLAGLSVPAVDPGPHAKWVDAVAKDLVENASGRSLVLVGPRQPVEVQAIGHLLNAALGNVGHTVRYANVTPSTTEEAGLPAFASLLKEIAQHQVSLLVVTAQNPVFNAPADLELASGLAAVPFSIYLAAYPDETAAKARWVVPAAHPFETWGDGIAANGSHVPMQPLLAPLFDGQSEFEVLGWLAEDATQAHELLYSNWHQHVAPGEAAFDDTWNALLRKGFTPTADAESVELPVAASASAILDKAARRPPAGELELGLYPSYQVHDGRFARNGQLLELPDPVTKLTWTNAAIVSPKTAERLGIATNDIVELSLHGQTIRLPTVVLPSHADDSVSVALGFGQISPLSNDRLPVFLATGPAAPNLTGERAGASAYPLRRSDALWFASGLKLQKTGDTRELAFSQEHWTMEGRELAIEVPATALSAHEPLGGESATLEAQPSFYDPVKDPGYKWAMTIDLARCTGCSACVVACQSENNIPIVGEEQVRRGREMHWLRLDRYFTGESLDDPGAITQPVACVHCENAPCEYVCPVNATVHSDEGLNEMVYNRCVGTRYCSNNCPYHVRRFNYLNYQYGNKTETEKMVFNPEVTVRSRGVMEKCTYCVQRIERGRISARVQGREIRDGDIRTACQSVCPTQAITFGTLSDPGSQVSRLRRDPRSYQLLKELGTRPRTTHLVRVKNKNPELS